MSLTSLIDVIFLLLLFFMLTSTFSRFAEVELASGTAGTGSVVEPNLVFLRLSAEDISLNGQSLTLADLPEALAQNRPQTAPDTPETPRKSLVSMAPDVTAQRLTDLLGVLRGVPGITPVVMGGS
ncbi:MAG: biopolymer transporter ExbD [Sulfitobacter sp.]